MCIPGVLKGLVNTQVGDMSGCMFIVSDRSLCVNCLLPRAVSGPGVCRLDLEQVK